MSPPHPKIERQLSDGFDLFRQEGINKRKQLTMNDARKNLPAQAHRFSFHSANAMLPLVRSIAKDVHQLLKTIGETKERLSAISVTKPASSRSPSFAHPKMTPYSTEVESIIASVEKKQERLEDCVQELEDLNLVAPEVDRPFVDFPAIYDGKDVCLCWKIGEDKILHWHLPSEACGDRRPVDLRLVPAKNELSGSL